MTIQLELPSEAVSDRSEENDAVAKVEIYAALGVQHCWIVRGDADSDEIDGMITMYELKDGGYEVVATGWCPGPPAADAGQGAPAPRLGYSGRRRIRLEA